MKSMQDKEFGNKWVDSNVICCSSSTVVNESMSVPSGDVMSSEHHDLDLVLKSPNVIVKDGGRCFMKLRNFSIFDKNSSTSTVVRVGDR